MHESSSKSNSRRASRYARNIAFAIGILHLLLALLFPLPAAYTIDSPIVALLGLLILSDRILVIVGAIVCSILYPVVLYFPIKWLSPEFLRSSSDHCQSCDYDLTGNVSGICSECGTAIPPVRAHDRCQGR